MAVSAMVLLVPSWELPMTPAPCGPADDPRAAELVALGELVVDDGGRAEEEVLERDADGRSPVLRHIDLLVQS